MSFIVRFVRQWIAGETLNNAFTRVKSENKAGIGAIINFLGEHVREAREAEMNVAENLLILKYIEEYKVNASLSIKLTQLGLDMEKTSVHRTQRIS